MPAIWDALDHREQALAIGFLVVMVGALAIRGVRRSVPDLLKTLVTPPLGPLLLLGLIYIVALVTAAAALGIWTMPLLGVTIAWALGSAGFMFTTVNDSVSDSEYFEKALRRSIRWTLVLEAIVAIFVFDLLFELLLLPVLVVLATLSAFMEDKPEYPQAKRLVDVVLGSFGLFLIAHAVWGIATDFASFWTLENLMRLLLPPALTIAFMPYAYFLRVYVRWEQRRFDRRWRRRGLAAG